MPGIIHIGATTRAVQCRLDPRFITGEDKVIPPRGVDREGLRTDITKAESVRLRYEISGYVFCNDCFDNIYEYICRFE